MATVPPHSWFQNSSHRPKHLINISIALRLSDLHFHRKRLGLILSSSFHGFYHADQVLGNKEFGRERTILSKPFLFDIFSSTCSSCLCFFSENGNARDLENKENVGLETSLSRSSSNGRLWTNVLLAINVLVFVGQITTRGKLMMWGAKINSLIDKGQLWRLATSSFLHANIGHLMVNCYSLNSVGPTVERITGPRRFLAVYFTSAIASSIMSYWFCTAPAVGASGAIFGLVGSFAVFVLRHRSLIKDGKHDLYHIANVIVLNMAIGIVAKGIDNWGHLGGLLGGASMSWLVGPAWSYKFLANNGRSVFVDKSPISLLINRIKGLH
uniref:Rhomboid protein Illhe_RBL10 n=1 Tax=Illicium henryi TaxID=114516 RepID=A0A0A7E6G5_9MAGN|nr:rhomboid protein Illhe_RBL10 [Illicium henryi]